MDKKQFNLVFLADDDADDREFFKSACSEVNSALGCRTFTDGKLLLDYLNTSGNPLPDIIFLDINMPRKDGFQCIEEIRNSEHASDVCIIMYSTSNSPRDVKKSYELGANGFVQKPSSFNHLKQLLDKIFSTDWKDPCQTINEQNFVVAPTDYIDKNP